MALTTYSDGRRDYDAIYLTWEQVRSILGRDHAGTSEDDDELICALIDAGAPAWVDEATEGWTDDHGWGLIGPRKAN